MKRRFNDHHDEFDTFIAEGEYYFKPSWSNDDPTDFDSVIAELEGLIQECHLKVA